MNEKLKKVTTTVKEKWSGFSKMVKVLIISVPIAVVAIIIILAVILNQKDSTVLYSGLTTEEASEIAGVISGLGVNDVSFTSDGDVIVPEEQADYLRMQLTVQGYPKSSANYDIWNDGVDLWSTDSDKREVQRQQRETRIAATLATLDAVQTATVNLDTGEKKDYVLVDDKSTPTCSIVLRLRDGYELTNAEVRAIFNMVTSSVDGLINDNVSLMDTQGREYEWISLEEEENGERDASGTLVAAKRLNFQREMQAAIKADLDEWLTKIYGENGYAINVSAILNYDIMTTNKEEFFPSGDDNTGVTNHELHVEEGGKLDADGNLVGVTPNADASPDYPTLEGLEDGQSYYYKKDEIQYDVTNIKTEIIKDGYSIDNLSVAVMLNTNSMTEAEREAIQDLVANAAGTDIENVSVFNTSFALRNNGGSTVNGDYLDISTRPVDSYRNMLLYIVVGLGALLIILLIVSLFMSRSRKKKIRRRQEQALVAAAAANSSASPEASSMPDMPEEVDFNIASLTEEANKDSRETILKREIADFSNTNPEIVASIIKNMLRDEK